MSPSEMFEYCTSPAARRVDPVVEAHVPAVVVAEDRGEQQGVVQRRVEDALHRFVAHPGPPRGPAAPFHSAVAARGDLLEVPARVLGVPDWRWLPPAETKETPTLTRTFSLPARLC